MIFTDLCIRNFLGVSSVDINLDNKGLILVQGVNNTAGAFDSNGSGKSTVFADSICWVLFGETVRGLKGDSVVRKQSKTNCMVSLTVVDEEDEYVVTRYRKHNKHKNSVHLFKNGENITSKSDTDTTNIIRDLLDLDYMSFTNSIVFGDGISKKFASATDSEKKEILEKMLQIDVFKKCSEIARQRLNNINSDMNSTLIKLDAINTTIKDKEKYLNELHEKEEYARQRAEETRIKYEDEISKAKTNIQRYQDEIAEYVELLKGMDSDKKDIDNMKVTLKNLYDMYSEAKSKAINYINKLNTLYSDMDSKNKQLSDLISGVNVPKFCKACGQSLPVKDTTHLQNHLKQELKELLDKMPGLKEEVSKSEENSKYLQGLWENYDAKIRDKVREFDTNKNKILSNMDINDSKIKQEQKNIVMYTSRIEEAIEESNKAYSSIIESVVKDIEISNSSYEVTNDIYTELRTEKDNLEFWVNAYGNKGIKNMLLNDVTPFLNTRTNYYLSYLSDSTMEVEFDTETKLKSGKTSEKFGLTMKNKAGDDSYGGSSGGEKKRVDVAINMALQDLVHSRSHKKIDFIIYDEVFDALDETGCENVIKLLVEKASMYGSVFVITHNEHLQQLFPTTITVEKTEEGTILHS